LRSESRLIFGTAGVPHSAEKRSSVSGIHRIRALGLDAMELQFVRRVSMGEATAGAVRMAAEHSGVLLSAHAPYYINLNSKDPEKVRASLERLLKAARVAALCGARSVVFHAAYHHNDPPAVVYERVKARLETIVAQLRDEALDVCLRPETSGRPSQFGSLDEILRLSAEIEGVSPCIDFGHLHARSAGAVNSYAEFEAVLEKVGKALGTAALQDMHMHLQGIAYTEAGEQKHLTLAASDARYEELLQALIDWNVGGRVICESPSLEEDALLLQRTYVCQASSSRQAGDGGPVS
jgi:deoxyribonuclease-4